MKYEDDKNLSIKTTLKLLKILYVEDEEPIRKSIAKILNYFCDNILAVESAEKAIVAYKEFKPDIIICDINLPKMNGIDFVKWIRSFDNKSQVFLLTAYTEKDYLLDAIKLNLVEYLIKPINFDILRDNLELATKKIVTSQTVCVEFISGAIYYYQERNVKFKEKSYYLTAKEIKLLNYLIKNKLRRISKEELKIQLWDEDFYDYEGALKSLVSKLRVKIGKESIENISGVGYRIILRP